MTTRSHRAGPVTRALIAALQDTAPKDTVSEDASLKAGTPNIRRIVGKLIDRALGGDLSAIKEIFDRVDGKAPGGAAGLDGDEPQKVIFEWKTSE